MDCKRVEGVDILEVVSWDGAWDWCPNCPFLGARLSSVRWFKRFSRESLDCKLESVETVSWCSLVVSDSGKLWESSLSSSWFRWGIRWLENVSRNPLSSPYGVGAILSSLFLSTTSHTSSSLIQSPLQLSSSSAYLIALKGMGPAPLVQCKT